jgi:hypothetical protein
LAPATFPRHRHQHPSGIWGCADQVISRPQVLHCILLRSKPTSFRNCKATAWSQTRNARNILFGPPSSRSIPRLYDGLGTKGISWRLFLYSLTTSEICCTILFSEEEAHNFEPFDYRTTNGCNTVTGSVLHRGCHIKITEKKANWIHVCCS